MRPIYLRTARDRRHLTQEELADQTGIAQNTISILETRQIQRPIYATVVKLAKALDVDPARLRFGPDPRAVDPPKPKRRRRTAAVVHPKPREARAS